MLDDEAGGAVAAFRHLVACPAGDMLDPILMTGSTVLVDDDLSRPFLKKHEHGLQSVISKLCFEMKSWVATTKSPVLARTGYRAIIPP